MTLPKNFILNIFLSSVKKISHSDSAALCSCTLSSKSLVGPRTYGIVYHDLQQAFIGTAWSHIRSISLYIIVPTGIVGGLIGERMRSKTAQ